MISGDYQLVDSVPTELWTAAWDDPAVARAQAALTLRELADFLDGKIAQPYAVFIALIERVLDSEQSPTLLDIGAGVGHYERLARLASLDLHVTSFDRSPTMRAMARRLGVHEPPHPDFLANLPDKSFSAVLLSAVLSHEPDWRKLLAEAKRISARWLILHRIPCFSSMRDEAENERLYVKEGYGHQMGERFFSEAAVLSAAGETVAYGPARWSHSELGWQTSWLLDIRM